MEEFIKVTAKTVEDAILEASIQLKTTSDNIEYRIIERESRGFLGIGAKKALIEARRKVLEEDIIGEVFREKTPSKKAPVKKEADAEKKAAKKPEKKAVKEVNKTEKKAEKAEKKTESKPENKPESKPDGKADNKQEHKPEKTEKQAKPAKPAKKEDKAPVKEAVKEEKETAERKAEPAAAVTETEKKKPAAETAPEETESVPKVPADPETVKNRAETFLTQMLSAMGVEAKVETSYEDGTLNVNLEGEDMGVLIGKRGQTLDSIQYLTSLVVNKGKAAYVRVKIDTENYRERRKATLENLAKNMAFKVKKTRRPAYLEPMNPYERRIIHSALQGDPYVTTHSEGDEPARKVVITLRKREREEAAREYEADET